MLYRHAIALKKMLRNAREIASSIQERARYTKHYEKALELCQIHIDIAARMNKSSCFFEVPEFIFGYPLYDINTCIMFITEKLQEKEYFVHYFIPKLLYISWELPDNQNTNAIDFTFPTPRAPPSAPSQGSKNKNGPKKETKSILSYKPSGKLTLDLS